MADTVSPSFINWQAFGGPVLRYEGLTLAQVESLGITPDTNGASVRKRGKLFDVIAAPAAIRTDGFMCFLGRLVTSVPLDA